jgi:hypothetical protein
MSLLGPALFQQQAKCRVSLDSKDDGATGFWVLDLPEEGKEIIK